MKRQLMTVLIMGLILPLGSISVNVNAMDDQIEVKDETGDVVETGTGTADVNNKVDITYLSLRYVSFPYILNLQVNSDYDRNYDGSDLKYTYAINMDFDKDGSEDIILRYIIPAVTPVMIMYKEGGGTGTLEPEEWSIEDGNTLSVQLKEEYMYGFAEDMNVEVSSTVANKEDQSSSTDYVQAIFGDPVDDDDDTSDGDDDDTSTDDDDDDAADVDDPSEDGDDTSGFGFLGVVMAILVSVVVTMRRKKRI